MRMQPAPHFPLCFAGQTFQTPSNGKPVVLPVSVCAACTKPILDHFIMKVNPDLEYHAQCLKCVECSVTLDENSTCYIKEGRTLCRTDYLRMYGVRCAKCRQPFSRSDLVMRAKHTIYHTSCFQCSACSRLLAPGDEFALRQDGIFCRDDCEIPGVLKKEEQLLRVNNFHCHLDKVDETKVENYTEYLTPIQSPQSPSSSIEDDLSQDVKSLNKKSSATCGATETKATRIRTVMNEKQLHTLRTCYHANPRPDALMKEQLVEMTGLSPRVIRVWFQNKRCKDKKRSIAMKQVHHMQAEKKIHHMNGVPLVVSSPIHQGLGGDVLQFNSGTKVPQNPGDLLTSAHQGDFDQLMLGFDNISDGSVMSDLMESPRSDEDDDTASFSLPSN